MQNFFDAKNIVDLALKCEKKERKSATKNLHTY